MASNYEEVYIRVGVDTKSFDSSISGIKKEMATLKGMIGSSILSKEENDALKARFGDIKGQFEDLTIAASAVDTGDVFGNMARAGGVAAQAVGGVIGTMSLLGIETKKTGELEKQLLTAISIGNALQAVADAKRLKSLAVAYAEKFKELILFKNANVVAAQSVAIAGADTVAKGAQAGATGLLTKAQLAFNAAVRANPLGVFLTVITAVIAGVTLLVSWFNKANKATEEANASWKSTIDYLNQVNDAQKEVTKTNQEYTDQLEVQKGIITEYEAERRKVTRETKVEIDKIYKEELKALQDLDTQKFDSEKAYMEARKMIFDKTSQYVAKVYEKEGLQKELINQKEIDDNKKKEEELKKQREQAYKDTLQKQKELREKIRQINNQSNDDLKKSLIELKQAKLESTILLFDEENANNEIIALNKYIKTVEKEMSDFEKFIKKERENQKQLGKIGGGEDPKLIVETAKYYDRLKNIELNYSSEYQDNIRKRKDMLEKGITDDRVIKLQKLQFDNDINKRTIEDAIKANEEQLKTLKIGSDEYKNVEEALKNNKERQRNIEEKYQTDIKLVVLKANNDIMKIYEDMDKGILESKQKTTEKLISITQSQSDVINRLIDVYRSEYTLVQDNETKKIAIRKKSTQEQIADNEEILKELKLQFDINEQLYKQQVELNTITLKGAELDLANANAFNSYIQQVFEIRKQMDETKKSSQEILQNDINNVLGYAQMGLQVFSDFMNTIMSQQLKEVQRQVEENVTAIQKAQDEAIGNLDKLLERQIISQAEYTRQKEEIDRKANEKVKQEKEKAAKKEREYRLWQAIIGGAGAVINGLQTTPFFPLGIIMGVLAGVLAGVQIAAIASEPLPTFAKGGLVLGKSHADGGVVTEMEGGEFVVQKSVVNRPGMKDFLTGVNNSSTNTPQQSSVVSVNRDDLRAVVQEVASIPVQVVETDVTQTQRRVSTIETRASW